MSDDRRLRDAALAAAMRAMGSNTGDLPSPTSRRYGGHSLGSGGYGGASSGNYPGSSCNAPQRPTEHFITISQNGTILGATEQITGLPPNSLLMQSNYDTVNEDDVVGLKAISKYFWEKGQPKVEAYFRRQTVEGEWIWLSARVATTIEVPVPGAIIQEQVAKNAEMAQLISRTTRIAAILIDAIDIANNPILHHDGSGNASPGNGLSSDIDGSSLPPELAGLMGTENEKEVLQAFMGVEASNRSKKGGVRSLLDRARNEKSSTSKKNQADETATGDPEKVTRRTSDSNAIADIVKGGGSVDLGKMLINPAELKIVCYVLMGKIPVNELGPLIITSLNSPNPDLSGAMDSYVKHRESQTPLPTSTGALLPVTPSATVQPTGTDARQRDRSSRGSTGSQTSAGRGDKGWSSGLRDVLGRHRRRSSQTSASNLSPEVSLLPATETIPNPRNGLLLEPATTANITTLNLSYTGIGNSGIELLSSMLVEHNPILKTLDISFCGVEEKGMLAFARAMVARKRKGLNHVEGVIVSGNFISYKSAKELGMALSSAKEQRHFRKKLMRANDGTGYDEDDEWDDDDDEEEMDTLFGKSGSRAGGVATKKGKKERSTDPATGGGPRRVAGERRKPRKHPTGMSSKTGGSRPTKTSKTSPNKGAKVPSKRGETNSGDRKMNATSLTKTNTSSTSASNNGLQLFHAACCSLNPESFCQLLLGLGQDCPIREMNVSSNNLGSDGASQLMAFLEGKGIPKYKKGQPVMAKLDRVDMSNNNLGNEGTTKLTRAISKRTTNVNIVDLRLSSNEIGASGIETIMNKLLQHNIMNLSLDNNVIADRGCQLIAASLSCMHHLSKLSLSFNQIGSRGVNALMRALVGCESLKHLGLSGNIIKISGSIGMGFALSQHPRLSSLELENCCLSQVAQCHITAGIISNRWVPMKNLTGFLAGPPMVAIGALDVVAQGLSNEECFTIRRDISMKAIFDWMETNRGSGRNLNAASREEALANNMSAQSAYHRMLDWLSRIPFDEDELSELRSYFYDADGGDGDRTSDGNINLRLRGDLLAALGSEIVDEIREETKFLPKDSDGPVGLDVSGDEESHESEEYLHHDLWMTFDACKHAIQALIDISDQKKLSSHDEQDQYFSEGSGGGGVANARKRGLSDSFENGEELEVYGKPLSRANMTSTTGNMSESSRQSDKSGSGKGKQGKARINMFRPFAEKLEMLKGHAQEMMDHEPDPYQQDIIAQQFAEASLTLLRQLRYHCMNSGLDGWRQGKLRRKVLIVDDSMVTRKMVSRAFEKANFIVDTAANGEEGVMKLKESIYDIAFMDIDMPIMNGFDATKALRDWEDLKRPGARQPICALTAAYVDDFERSELMKFKEAGLDVMESKPCNIPRLFKVVDDVSPMFSDLSISVTQTQKEMKAK